MLHAERIRKATRIVGAVLLLTEKQGDQEFIRKLAAKVSEIMHADEQDMHAAAKLDYVIKSGAQTAAHVANVQNMVAILLGLVHGQALEIPDELLKKVGLTRREQSNLVIAR